MVILASYAVRKGRGLDPNMTAEKIAWASFQYLPSATTTRLEMGTSSFGAAAFFLLEALLCA
jgi:hypothetical protein